MTREFAIKRFKEQSDYIDKIQASNLSKSRKREIISSALSQKLYFYSKLKTMSKSTVEKVKEFHETFEHPIGLNPQHNEPLNIRQLRIKLLFEELQELAVAGDIQDTFLRLCCKSAEELRYCPMDGNNVDKVEELDAITDLQYVLDGKKLTSGLHTVTDQAFDLIHQNNMRKGHKSHEHAMETVEKLNEKNNISVSLYTIIPRNGVFILQNEHGKTTKPWDHKKVDLTYLVKQ